MSEHTLALALECLGDLSARWVVVGGTAHRMFPRHPLGQEPGFELLTTEDVDLAAPLELRHDGRRDLLDRFRDSDIAREAAAIAATQRRRPPDSEQIVGACELGLRRVLRPLVPELQSSLPRSVWGRRRAQNPGSSSPTRSSPAG